MRQSELLVILDQALQERDAHACDSACALLALQDLNAELKALQKDYRVLRDTYKLTVKDRAAVCEQLAEAQGTLRNLRKECAVSLFTVEDHMRAVHDRVFRAMR